MTDTEASRTFIDRWSGSRGMERAVYQQFFTELCVLMNVDPPDPDVEAAPDYCFEKRVDITHPDGRTTARRIDLYKKGCFIIEAKQGSEAGDVAIGTARRGTESWNRAMRAAFGQALQYASYLPEGKPPFLITCDIGHVFEIWTGFDGDYGGFGARRTVKLEDLADPETLEYLRTIFTDPLSLDPSLHAAVVTRDVASRLAELAKTLEADGHDPEIVAQFLMRCLFTMFAEDVRLLPEDLFTNALRERWVPEPRKFQFGIEQLWKAMDEGMPFGFEDKLLRFNGNLFAFNSSLPLKKEQLEMLLEAADRDWSNVEPAIFGTLVERALSPKERHSLGAHFTPRAYIERLVRPTIIEPIRAEWDIVQAEVHQLLGDGEKEPTKTQRNAAIKTVKAFHKKLCEIKVLDPACGSGNFLYVTLDLFKRIEAEIVKELQDLGESQSAFELEGFMVNPGQFLGIEVNPRAREIADLVLWIGYLQWYRRTHDVQPPEPVLRRYENIECRDAVLDYDRQEVVLGEDGKPVTRWDGETTKKHPVTGEDVPDESAQVPIYKYINPRKAEWPDADFVVGNPPFIGKSRRRAALGDGYVETLNKAYPIVPDGVDYVMYWWNKASELVRARKMRRFGLITTNSITQSLNRRVVEEATDKSVLGGVIFAIPDHPWVDSDTGAAVRIAMTAYGSREGQLPQIVRVIQESSADDDEVRVELVTKNVHQIHADLTGGADVVSAVPLKANESICSVAFVLFGSGFIISKEETRFLEPESFHPLLSGRDVVQSSRGKYVIDLYPYDEGQAAKRFPKAFQHVINQVKPGRDQIRDPGSRTRWWRFGRDKPELRKALSTLSKFIVTSEVAKHRVFIFVDSATRTDHSLITFAFEDAWFLGALSSRIHVCWALAAGGTLEDRPRYNKTRCFEPFPFPDCSDDQKQRIRDLGEALDAHRKRQQAAHPKLTLTNMYNVLQKLRSGEELTKKEKNVHEQGLVSVLMKIHDDLDAAVADAYGWPADLTDEEILERLVALNLERAKEEKRGIVRRLRPDFQNPNGANQIERPCIGPPEQGKRPPEQGKRPPKQGKQPVTKTAPKAKRPWPKTVPDQIKAIRDMLFASNEIMTAEEVASEFKKAHRKTVRQHLATLESLGLLVAHEEDGERRWNARQG